MPFVWERLIDLIDQDRVVPIIGHDVARVTVEGRTIRAYDYVAERLAARLGIDVDVARSPKPVDAVATAHLACGGDWNDLYYETSKACEELYRLPLPAAMLKLAEIQPLRLFLSTTFDSLMKRALDQVRYNGDDITRSLAMMRSRAEDTSEELVKERIASVFHLLGKAAPSADFAVTEEDMLEWMQALQSENRRPAHLFRYLTTTDLLLIGNNFEGWLARFFIRTLKQQRLWVVSDCTGFVADDEIRNDVGLLGFLKRSPYVKVYDGPPENFIDALHTAWREKHPPGTTENAEAQRGGIESCIVFISYASEDQRHAEAVVESLSARGIHVWYDKRNLQPGDPFDPKIEEAIRHAAVFVPILSRACHTDRRRFFRREWSYATDIAREVRLSTRFINPIVVDDLPYDDPDIPHVFREKSWLRLEPDSAPSVDWVETVQRTVRDCRSPRRGLP